MNIMIYFHAVASENKKKIIPLNIADLLTPRALAFLIMDDGSKISSNKMHFILEVIPIEKYFFYNKLYFKNFSR